MDIRIVCGTWIEEEDEKVIAELKASDRWLSVEELSGRTGLPQTRVRRTLRLLKQQMDLYKSRSRRWNWE